VCIRIASSLSDDEIVKTAQTILKQDFSASTRLQALIAFLSTNSAAQGVWSRRGELSTLHRLCSEFASLEEQAQLQETESSGSRSVFSSRLAVFGVPGEEHHEDEENEEEDENEDDDDDDGDVPVEIESGADGREDRQAEDHDGGMQVADSQEDNDDADAQAEEEPEDDSMMISEDDEAEQVEGPPKLRRQPCSSTLQPSSSTSMSTTTAAHQAIRLPADTATVVYPGLFEFL